MSTRFIAAVTVAAVVAVPAAASGGPGRVKRPAPAPRCQLSDPRGDARSPAFDITCANVHFGRKTIVGVLGVASTRDPEPHEGLAGATWTLTFTVKGIPHAFQRVRPAGVASRYDYTFDGMRVRDVKVTATEFRWTIPRTSVRGSKPEKLSAAAEGLVSRDSAGAKQR